MQINFDNTTDAQRAMVRDRIKTVRNGFSHDTGLDTRAPKLAGPPVEPPTVPPVNPNPRKHEVVAWRHDGVRLDTTRHDTKEAALEYGRALPWCVYYKFAVLDGRNIIERHNIAIPTGMALDDNGMPIKL